MDLQNLMPWLAAAALILSLGNTVTQFFTSGAKKTAADLDAFKVDHEQKHDDLWTRLTDLESRVQRTESELRHLPDKDVVHRLELMLGEMKIEIVKIGASADASARATARLENYLMEKT